MKLNVKYRSNSQYKRVLGAALANPLFDKQYFYTLSDQDKVNYAYGLAAIQGLDKFKQKDFDVNEYEKMLRNDKASAWNYLAYKAFEEKSEDTNTLFDQISEHFSRMEYKEALTKGQKFFEGVWTDIKGTGYYLLNKLDQFFDILPNVIYTIGSLFGDMDGLKEWIQEDKWMSWMAGDKSIDDLQYENRLDRWYLTDRYHNLEDAIDGFNLFGAPTWGNLIDFVGGVLGSVGDMSVFTLNKYIPGGWLGSALYWSLMASETMEENTYLDNRGLALVKTVGGVLLEAASESMFTSGFGEPGLFNTSRFYNHITDVKKRFFASLLTNAITEGIEEMTADVFDALFNIALSGILEHHPLSASDRESITNPDFGTWFEQTLSSGLSGALIGIAGQLSSFATTKKGSIYTVDGQEVTMSRMTMWAINDMMSLMDGKNISGQENTQKVIEQMRKKNPNITDAEIKQTKAYQKALKKDQASQQSVINSIDYMKEMLGKLNIDIGSFDSNYRDAFTQALHYLTNYELNYREKLSKRKQAKYEIEHGERPTKFTDIRASSQKWLDIFNAYGKGARVVATRVIDSSDVNEQLRKQAVIAGYDAIVVVDMGTINGAKPSLLVPIGNTLFVDAKQYDGSLGSRSEFLLTSIANNIVLNIFSSKADGTNFFNTLSKAVLPTAHHNQTYSQFIDSKGGLEVANIFLVKSLLTNPQIMKIVFGDGKVRGFDAFIDAWNTTITLNNLILRSQGAEDIRELNHIMATVANNMLDGLLGELKQIDPELFANLKGLVENTPLRERVKVISQLLKKHQRTLQDNSTSLVSLFLKDMGFVETTTETITVEKDKKLVNKKIKTLRLKQSVADWFYQSGIINYAEARAMEGGYESVKAPIKAEDITMELVFKTIIEHPALQYHLAINNPDFRDNFIAHLKNIIETHKDKTIVTEYLRVLENFLTNTTRYSNDVQMKIDAYNLVVDIKQNLQESRPDDFKFSEKSLTLIESPDVTNYQKNVKDFETPTDIERDKTISNIVVRMETEFSEMSLELELPDVFVSTIESLHDNNPLVPYVQAMYDVYLKIVKRLKELKQDNRTLAPETLIEIQHILNGLKRFTQEEFNNISIVDVKRYLNVLDALVTTDQMKLGVITVAPEKKITKYLPQRDIQGFDLTIPLAVQINDVSDFQLNYKMMESLSTMFPTLYNQFYDELRKQVKDESKLNVELYVALARYLYSKEKGVGVRDAIVKKGKRLTYLDVLGLFGITTDLLKGNLASGNQTVLDITKRQSIFLAHLLFDGHIDKATKLIQTYSKHLKKSTPETVAFLNTLVPHELVEAFAISGMSQGGAVRGFDIINNALSQATGYVAIDLGINGTAYVVMVDYSSVVLPNFSEFNEANLIEYFKVRGLYVEGTPLPKYTRMDILSANLYPLLKSGKTVLASEIIDIDKVMALTKADLERRGASKKTIEESVNNLDALRRLKIKFNPKGNSFYFNYSLGIVEIGSGRSFGSNDVDHLLGTTFLHEISHAIGIYAHPGFYKQLDSQTLRNIRTLNRNIRNVGWVEDVTYDSEALQVEALSKIIMTGLNLPASSMVRTDPYSYEDSISSFDTVVILDSLLGVLTKILSLDTKDLTKQGIFTYLLNESKGGGEIVARHLHGGGETLLLHVAQQISDMLNKKTIEQVNDMLTHTLAIHALLKTDLEQINNGYERNLEYVFKRNNIRELLSYYISGYIYTNVLTEIVARNRRADVLIPLLSGLGDPIASNIKDPTFIGRAQSLKKGDITTPFNMPYIHDVTESKTMESFTTQQEWKGENYTLYNEDVFNVIPRLLNEGVQVDSIITDPPYNIGKTFTPKKGAEYDSRDSIDLHKYIIESAKLLKNRGVFATFINYAQLEIAKQAFKEAGIVFVQEIIWEKPNRPGLGHADERIIIGQKVSNGQRADIKVDITRIQNVSATRALKQDSKNLTAKPYTILNQIIKMLTKKGDVIFDGTAGGANIGIVALANGRKYIGSEIDYRQARHSSYRLGWQESGRLDTANYSRLMPSMGVGFDLIRVQTDPKLQRYASVLVDLNKVYDELSQNPEANKTQYEVIRIINDIINSFKPNQEADFVNFMNHIILLTNNNIPEYFKTINKVDDKILGVNLYKENVKLPSTENYINFNNFTKRLIELLPILQNEIINGAKPLDQTLSNFNHFVDKLIKATPNGQSEVNKVINLLVKGANIKTLFEAFNLQYRSPKSVDALQIGDPVLWGDKMGIFIRHESNGIQSRILVDGREVFTHKTSLKLVDFTLDKTKVEAKPKGEKEIKPVKLKEVKQKKIVKPKVEEKTEVETKKVKTPKDVEVKKELVKKLSKDYELHNIPLYTKGVRITNTIIFNRYYVAQVVSTDKISQHGVIAEVVSEPKMIDKKTMEKGVVKIYLHSGVQTKYQVDIRGFITLDITKEGLNTAQYATARALALQMETIANTIVKKQPTKTITNESLRLQHLELQGRYNTLIDQINEMVSTYQDLQEFLSKHQNTIDDLYKDTKEYGLEYDKLSNLLSKKDAIRIAEEKRQTRLRLDAEIKEEARLKRQIIENERAEIRKAQAEKEATIRQNTIDTIENAAKTLKYMEILDDLIKKKITTVEQFHNLFVDNGVYNSDLIRDFWGLFNPHGNAAKYRAVLIDVVGEPFYFDIYREFETIRNNKDLVSGKINVLLGIGRALRQINITDLPSKTEGVLILIDIFTQNARDQIYSWLSMYEKYYDAHPDIFKKDLESIFNMIKHPTDYIQGLYDMQGNLNEYALHVLDGLLEVLPETDISIAEFFPEKVEMPKTTTLFDLPPVEKGKVFLPLSKPNEKTQEFIKNSPYFDKIVNTNEKVNAMTLLDHVLRFQGESVELSKVYREDNEEYAYGQSLEREFHDAFDKSLQGLSGTAWSAIFATLIDMNKQGLLAGVMPNALQLISYYKTLVDFGQGIRVIWHKAHSEIAVPALSKAGQVLSYGKKTKMRYNAFTNITQNTVEKYLYALRQHYIDVLGLSYEEAHKKAQLELSGFSFDHANYSVTLPSMVLDSKIVVKMVEDTTYFGIAPQESDDARLQAVDLSLEKQALIQRLQSGDALSIEDLQTLWEIAQSESNYEVLMALQKYLQDRARKIIQETSSFKDLFSKDRAKRITAWELVGRKIHGFRFISMLSNPSVFIKAMMQTRLNSWVDRGIVNPITNKILNSINKKGRGDNLQVKNGNYHIYDSVTNKYYNYVFSKEQKTWRLESTTSHRSLARAYNNAQINGIIDPETKEVVAKGLKDIIEATPTTKNRLSIKTANDQYNLAKTQKVSQQAIDFVDEVFVTSKLLEFIQENIKMRYLGDNAIDAYISRANPFVSKTFILLYNSLYRFLEEPKRKVVQKQMTWYLQNLVETNKTYDLKQTVDAEIQEAYEKGDHKRITELQETFREEVSKLASMAYLQSLEVVFKSSNAVFKFLSDIGRTHPAVKFFLDAVVPFPRVSSNILIQIFKHSPFGLIKTIVNLAQLKHGNLEANLKTVEGNMVLYNLAKDGAKGILGSAMYLLGFILGALGFVKLDEEKKYRGFTLDIGGLKIDVSNVSMLAPPLLLGASLSTFVTDWGNEPLRNATNSWLEQFSTLTFLGNIVETFQHYDKADGVLRFFDSYFLSYFPAIVKSLFKVIDPHVKDYSDANYFQRILYNIAPFVAPNKKDPYTGEDMLRYENPYLYDILNMISPVPIYKYPTSDVKSISDEYGVSLSNYGLNEMNFDDTVGKLNKNDRALYNETRGQAYNQLVTELVNSKEWEKASKEERISMLSSARAKATATAKVALWLSRNTSNHYYYVGDGDTITFVKSFLQDSRIRQIKKLPSGYSYIGTW